MLRKNWDKRQLSIATLEVVWKKDRSCLALTGLHREAWSFWPHWIVKNKENRTITGRESWDYNRLTFLANESGRLKAWEPRKRLLNCSMRGCGLFKYNMTEKNMTAAPETFLLLLLFSWQVCSRRFPMPQICVGLGVPHPKTFLPCLACLGKMLKKMFSAFCALLCSRKGGAKSKNDEYSWTLSQSFPEKMSTSSNNRKITHKRKRDRQTYA